ncbi:MAG: hypothetical protein K0S09_2286 [Sphingobacteriaceae bacterium]|jgi:ABC-type transport system involved in multi-copper enzyme maturation permease subunit|nr:hypothetical protein [Sphingobacteriaceae bacterium]
MKFRTIFLFEFGYQVGRLSTWLYLAVLLLFTFVMNLMVTPGDGVYANNTFHITAITIIGSLIWLVMSASIAGEAAARDSKTRMHPLTYSAPVTKLDYLGGRFLAALAINALLILALPMGVMLSFYLPGIEEGPMQAFRLAPYLNVYFLIALPGTFLATALQFSFAALSRQVMSSYLASLLLALVAQIIALTVAKLFGNWDLVKLLDPVGIAGIVGSELSTWTPTEKNTRLVTPEGMFLWNRVLWLSVAGVSLWATYLRFDFSNTASSSFWSRFRRKPKAQALTVSEAATVRTAALKVPQVQRNFAFAGSFRQTLTIASASFRKIARNPVGLTLLAAIAIVSAAFGNKIISQFGIPLIPTTQQVLAYLSAPLSNISTPWVVIPLLIIYFSGELVWMEKDAGLGDLTDASPVPDWVLFTGKFFGLSLIILAWLSMMMISGIAMQLISGYHKLEPVLYLQVLFGIQFVDYLLFAVLALVVHVVVNQKYIAYLVMLLVLSLIAYPSTFGVEHNLLIFGADPGWWYTDMRGFGNTIGPWLWFKAYWIAWALLLAVIASLLWARGREQSLKQRIKLAKSRFNPSGKWLAGIASVLTISLGSFIFYNTNILNQYHDSSDIYAQKAEYERTYSRYRNIPQPQVTATKLNMEIYPDRQQVDVHAIYTLVNRDSTAINSIHFGSIAGIEPVDIRFSRPAKAVSLDKKLSHYIYALKQPLEPGASVRLNFTVHSKQRGFRQSGTNTSVVKNGTYFTNYDLLPNIGYQAYRELKDAVIRKMYNLPFRPEVPSLYDANARKKAVNPDHNAFEAIIGTAADEVAVAPGTLLNTWTNGGRRYFHFKTSAPIRGEYSVLSGKYAVTESKWKDVDIRIYHHPGHFTNIGRMLRSIKASLEHNTRQFGPYPYKHLTVVEHGGSDGGASSEASMIDYGEQYALMDPDDSPTGFDLSYYILAHEVSHQWWGGAGLAPAYVEGAGVLVEGLAVYTGIQVLEKNYNEGHSRQYLSFLHSVYEMPRSLATASLLQANEPFLYYRKGGLAMYALSRYIGKEKVNAALRQLLQRNKSGELPLATTLNLYEELQKVTPDSLHSLLDDLFKKNLYWRLKTEKFAAKQTEAGWLVTIKVQAQKMVVDSAGKEHKEPMNDLLEVGIYEANESTKPMYLKMHRIRSGEQTIQVTVPRKPARGGIDPNMLMIDLRVDDNLMEMDE